MMRRFLAITLVLIYFVFLAANIVLAANIIVTTTVNVSATVPSREVPPVNPPSGGGGGGGGGSSSLPAVATQVVFSGVAYPASQVTIIKNSVKKYSATAGSDAKFTITIGDLEAGWVNFLIYVDDSRGYRSSSYSLPIYVTVNAITAVMGVFVAPTIDVDKTIVLQGEPVKVFGQSAPNSTVSIVVNSTTENNFNTTADANGWYFYSVDTKILNISDHQTRARSKINDLASPYSVDANFKVTAKSNEVTIPTSSEPVTPPSKPNNGDSETCNIIADVNKDCKVNLVDFSILAYWYKRVKPPVKLDLKKNGKIDLSDFSIMAYYWTG